MRAIPIFSYPKRIQQSREGHTQWALSSSSFIFHGVNISRSVNSHKMLHTTITYVKILHTVNCIVQPCKVPFWNGTRKVVLLLIFSYSVTFLKWCDTFLHTFIKGSVHFTKQLLLEKGYLSWGQRRCTIKSDKAIDCLARDWENNALSLSDF